MNHLTKPWLLLAAILLAACEPQDRRPGTWVGGELIETEITDWSFTNEHPEIYIQTHPWYGVPHSVTVVIATTGDRLFMPSIYFAEPKVFPDGKYWNKIVAANPDVEIKIGEQLFPRRIRLITDPAEFAVALEALASKYDSWRDIKDNPDEAPTYVLFSLDKR
jgi:hypothetical protein